MLAILAAKFVMDFVIFVGMGPRNVPMAIMFLGFAVADLGALLVYES